MTLSRKLFIGLAISSLWACEDSLNNKSKGSDKAVELFVNTYRTGLVTFCQSDDECLSLIKNNFDACIDFKLVKQMLKVHPKERSKIIEQISNRTMSCLEEVQRSLEN